MRTTLAVRLRHVFVLLLLDHDKIYVTSTHVEHHLRTLSPGNAQRDVCGFYKHQAV